MKSPMLCLVVALALPNLALAGKRDAQTQLTRAQGAVAAAERAGAATTAAQDYQVARQMLARADDLCAEREWDDCEMAAAKAQADGRLAEARSRQRKAEAATAELELAVETLRAELARQGGVR